MRHTKFFLFFLVLLVLLAPVLQSWLKVAEEPALKGFFKSSEPVSLKLFTWKGWFSGGFQEKFEPRVNGNIGFRKSLIRVANQYDYSLFGIIHAEGFVQGRERYLFEEDYIHEYTGRYFIGKAVIDRKLSRLKNVADSLRSHNIPFLLVFEPGKASFYPEYIPGRFSSEKKSQTNYVYFIQRSRELGLPFIDLNSYFLKMKDTARFPLFPRYGMHWSLYGVPFAVDTLVKAIEYHADVKLPGYTASPVISSFDPVGTDNDIGELLNLVCPLRPTPGGYPTIKFLPGQSGTLSALVVADSYYINICEDYGRNLFKSQDYWYYNRKLYPYHNNTPPVYVDKSGLREKLGKFDLVLLMVSEINLHCGFWNFADEAFLAFHPEIKDPMIYGIENEIRNDREWFRFMVTKAQEQQKPLEQMIGEDARYTFCTNYENLQGKTYWDTVYRITCEIRNNADWFSQVEKKAVDRQISVDSMLLLDAIYTYSSMGNKQSGK